jgi:hypothetical protein
LYLAKHRDLAKLVSYKKSKAKAKQSKAKQSKAKQRAKTKAK